MGTILLFGSKGFIGQHLASLLKDKEARFVAAEEAGVQNICDSASVKHLIEDCRPETIVNLAGRSAAVDVNLSELFAVNVWAVHSLLNIARDVGGVKRFIHASSANIYGHQDRIPIAENAAIRPINPYGLSKTASEHVVSWFQGDFETVCTRSFNCIGRGQKKQFFVPKLVDAFCRRQPILELGNLEVCRDFVDVRDATQVYWELIKQPNVRGIFNICSGNASPLKQVIHELESLTQFQIDVSSSPSTRRERDIFYQQGDPSKVIDMLGYKNIFGLRDTLRWMLEEN